MQGQSVTKADLEQISKWIWEIPKSHRDDMRVPARFYSKESLLDSVLGDMSATQLVNVATLPGIQKYSLCMPDMHQGYGFPIGGVGAFDVGEGIISPGGIGYDINCGVRLLSSGFLYSDIKEKVPDLTHAIFREVPSGVGKGGRLRLSLKEIDEYLVGGAEKMVKAGYGKKEDLGNIESEGCLQDADPRDVSKKAKTRGRDQVGTLGAGNHFVDVCYVDEIFDDKEAKRMGLFLDQITVLIHTGSRGLGHQIATDYVRLMMTAASEYKIPLADRELACAPFNSKEGQKYWRAMCAGANFAWANRQLITWEVREAWDQVLGGGHDIDVVYDVAHNIAKVEEYEIDGKKKDLVVHRKGATRAFPGQPVLIPGTMATHSYVLVGQEESMNQSFGSTCHGAGRRMSRSKARRTVDYNKLRNFMDEQGITVASRSTGDLLEEAPEAYKDIEDIVDIVHNVGIAKKVVSLRPVGVVKC